MFSLLKSFKISFTRTLIFCSSKHQNECQFYGWKFIHPATLLQIDHLVVRLLLSQRSRIKWSSEETSEKADCKSELISDSGRTGTLGRLWHLQSTRDPLHAPHVPDVNHWAQVEHVLVNLYLSAQGKVGCYFRTTVRNVSSKILLITVLNLSICKTFSVEKPTQHSVLKNNTD